MRLPDAPILVTVKPGSGKRAKAEELVSEHDEEGAGEEEWRQQQID